MTTLQVALRLFQIIVLPHHGDLASAIGRCGIGRSQLQSRTSAQKTQSNLEGNISKQEQNQRASRACAQPQEEC